MSRPSIAPVAVTLAIVTDPNSVLDQSQIQSNVITAIENYFTTVTIGGNIYRSEIIDTVMNIQGVIDVPESLFTSPANSITGQPAVRSVAGAIVVTY